MQELWRRCRAWFKADRLDGDISDELRLHAEMKAQELGSSLNARRAIGSDLLWRERARDAWGFAWLDDIVWDVRYALRQFAHSPGFTAVAIAMLALGIGVNAMVFSIVNAVLFKGYYGVKDNSQLVYMTSFEGCCVSYPDFLDWRAQAQSFAGMEITHGIGATLGDRIASREHYDATEVSAGTFSLVGARPILGRDFTPSDEQAAAAPVVLLQHEFWQQRFGADPGVLGRKIPLNGKPTEIIGVMPPRFLFPQRNEMWTPLHKTAEQMKRDNRETWMVVGRLKPGIRIQAAQAEMRAIGTRLEAAYPDTNKGLIPIVETNTEFLYGPSSTLLYASLWGAVGFVLLIACANLANLLLGRAVTRGREISLRVALGAGRGRIIRQLLVESLLLSVAGGIAASFVTRFAVTAFIKAAKHSQWMSWMSTDYSIDNQTLAYMICITILVGPLSGLAPALRQSRVDLNSSLKDSGRTATDGLAGRRLSNLLVSVEMALAVVLLVGAGLMVKSFVKMATAELGVDITNVISFNLSWETLPLPTPEQQPALYQRLLQQLSAVPGIESTALASKLPGVDYGSGRQPYELEGEDPAKTDRRARTTSPAVISPGYFSVLRTAILTGRDFTRTDQPGSEPVAIVNQRFAELNWPGENPVGKRLRLIGKMPGSARTVTVDTTVWMRVIGVTANIASDIRKPGPSPLVYVPYAQRPAPGLNFIARSAIAPEGQLKAIRAAIEEVSPSVTTYRLRPIQEEVENFYAQQKLYGTLFSAFAGIALLLAAAGLYAVLAQTVSQRTQEIGVRMAFGSSASEVLQLVLRQGLAPVVAGLAVGLVVSVAVNRLLASQLVQVTPGDPGTLITTGAILLTAAGLGCWIPARRAMRVDPVVALRHD